MINFIQEFINNLTVEHTTRLIEAVVIIAVLNILSPLFSYIVVKMFNWKKRKNQIKENAFYIPLRSFFKILGIYMAILFLQPTFNISEKNIEIVTKIFKMIVIINTAIGLSNSLSRKSRLVHIIKEKSDKEIDDATIRMTIRVVRVFIYIIAGFMIIADLGYDLSGLVTGLGLGSVVITIAAQDTIKNLLGGIMIFMDKPFKVGDYIKFDTYQGTVEDMTFRSTRLRTLENTIAQIPNAEISNATVVNCSKIEKRRFELKLGIVLNTDLNKIMELKDKILEFLVNEPNVIADTENVFFSDIGDSSYNISVFCYIDTADYIEFLNIKEQLNYEIMNIVNKKHIELAYDTKTIEIKNSIK